MGKRFCGPDFKITLCNEIKRLTKSETLKVLTLDRIVQCVHIQREREVLNHIESYNKAYIFSIPHYFPFLCVSHSLCVSFPLAQSQFLTQCIYIPIYPWARSASKFAFKWMLCFSLGDRVFFFFIWCFDIESISRHFLIEIIFNLFDHPRLFSIIFSIPVPTVSLLTDPRQYFFPVLRFVRFFSHYYAHCMLWKAITQ